MDPVFDVAIVGSGPAGVSAALPLLEAGLKVVMVDGGREQRVAPPDKSYLSHRYGDQNQWKWMLGEDYFSLFQNEEGSPKLRVPGHQNVFEDFLDENKIKGDNFVTVGSLAPGGLSNAWGCGVARLSERELSRFPFPTAEMDRSYERVTRRIGISGAVEDDLTAYYRLDEWSQAPIEIDEIHTTMLKKYERKKIKLAANGMKMGRSRIAVLKEGVGSREGCNLSGNCMWGCHRKAIYSAVDEIPMLKSFPNFKYHSGFVVERINSQGDTQDIIRVLDGKEHIIRAKKLILAAGTLASTRLVLKALNYKGAVPLESTPTAAFLLWFPGKLGIEKRDAFGLGQLSYALNVTSDISGFGSTFALTGIAATEFIRHLPLKSRFAIDFWRQIVSSCVVGNLFLPGHLSTSSAQLNETGGLDIQGGYHSDLGELMKQARSKLVKSYLSLGGVMLPKSFTVGEPGGDIHYSCTLPMRKSPSVGETDQNGQIFGLKNVYVADGASLPTLSEKSHTLTIMANADRISRHLVSA